MGEKKSLRTIIEEKYSEVYRQRGICDSVELLAAKPDSAVFLLYKDGKPTNLQLEQSIRTTDWGITQITKEQIEKYRAERDKAFEDAVDVVPISLEGIENSLAN